MIYLDTHTTFRHCIDELSSFSPTATEVTFICDGNALQFMIPRARYDIDQVLIRAEINQTFTVTFYKSQKLDLIVVDVARGIFADRLVSVIQRYIEITCSQQAPSVGVLDRGWRPMQPGTNFEKRANDNAQP